MTDTVAGALSSVTAESFRSAMACHAAGVAVVTTRDAAGRPWGLTVTSFSSVSLEPPLVLTCVAHRAGGYEAFAACTGFAVSLLDEVQQEIAQRFARSGGEKFSPQDSDDDSMCSPVVDGALCQLECRVHARYPAGDHLLLVGRVTQLRYRQGAPLVHHQRAFHTLRDRF
ncbi:flavin reductase family protein [Streptomyces sp. NPDC093510]|uniref:flavin reductase family protein n=1 Tax=Streptomyces sp. NPDC093510 TaxID=3155199 RepID=UPI00341A5247